MLKEILSQASAASLLLVPSPTRIQTESWRWPSARRPLVLAPSLRLVVACRRSTAYPLRVSVGDGRSGVWRGLENLSDDASGEGTKAALPENGDGLPSVFELP